MREEISLSEEVIVLSSVRVDNCLTLPEGAYCLVHEYSNGL